MRFSAVPTKKRRPPTSRHPLRPSFSKQLPDTQGSNTNMVYPAQPTTPPRTPRKGDRGPPATVTNSTTSVPESGSKQSRNKIRPRNVTTSPATAIDVPNTTPLTRVQPKSVSSSTRPMNTPIVATTAAYAGPTFHASPAPSALPIPSFYSKSVPDSPGLMELHELRGVSSPNEVDSPTRPLPNGEKLIGREESPLDFFFKADREEKARAGSASSSQKTKTGPFPPPAETPPTTDKSRHARHGSSSRGSANGIFAMELDEPSSFGQPYGPAFSTPYAERINAARLLQATRGPPQPDNKSDALKAFLFSSPSSASPSEAAANNPSRTPSIINNHNNNRSPSVDSPAATNFTKPSGRSSGLRMEVTPTASPLVSSQSKIDPHPQSASQNPRPSRTASQSSLSPGSSLGFTSSFRASSTTRSTDLKYMENSLRKMLKLDSTDRA